jgi:ketosteroid isomerase-like protein
MTGTAPVAGSTADLAAVTEAADRLLAAFSSHDRDGYFACFAPDATFLFHTSPDLLTSRSSYEQEWAMWEADGFHVDGCDTRDRRIDLVAADVAILTHRVRTRLAGVPEVQRERESIVFRRTPDGTWLAVHEHLSADPQEDA